MKRILICILSALALSFVSRAARSDDPGLTELETKHLANLRQVTFGLPRAASSKPFFSVSAMFGSVCDEAKITFLPSREKKLHVVRPCPGLIRRPSRSSSRWM